MDDEQFRYRARRLRDLAEPIGANVYFAPEAHAAYEAAGLIPPRQEPGQRRAPLAPSYFASRSRLSFASTARIHGPLDSFLATRPSAHGTTGFQQGPL